MPVLLVLILASTAAVYSQGVQVHEAPKAETYASETYEETAFDECMDRADTTETDCQDL